MCVDLDQKIWRDFRGLYDKGDKEKWEKTGQKLGTTLTHF